MGLCPKPRKFFEKNLTKNFTNGKVLAHTVRSTVESAVFVQFVGVGAHDDPYSPLVSS